MIKLGLTGGIGTGKSLVATVFEHLGVPVYRADIEARKFLGLEPVKEQLTKLFGSQIIDYHGNVDRKALAARVFSNPTELNLLNKLIHPLVKSDFENWYGILMNRSYVVHEAAILFESGFNLFFEKTVVVVAPPQICIQRVVTRDGVTPGEVLKRMNNQWDPELKAARADYILINDGNHMLLQQILALNKELTKLPATL